jgi:ribosomal-protein-alanine N-acetyltransferase
VKKTRKLLLEGRGIYLRPPEPGDRFELVLRFAFRVLKLHRLEANIRTGNVASRALVRRAGFVHEGFSRKYLKVCGRWRDHERWAILADTWLRRPR